MTGVRVAAGLFLLLATGCATQVGRVDREMVLPPGAVRHVLDDRQRFLMAVPVSDPMPVFPEDLRLRTQAVVCASFVVDADGNTVDVSTAEAGPACVGSAGIDAAQHARLREAVAHALSQWTWFGAAVCTFPGDVEPDDACRTERVAIQPVPLRLDYRFVFAPGGRVSADRSPGRN
ncbi:hypothetical protein E5843_00935 [Luteimonas yindakuii]|uniref:hypothetical protein n=1 Tax=Luteimonas yindakuii TaxID=2565782 RepID=UPI0010A30ACD|nr:hypothetical protein [Luteimonas yindakuii]QCO66720.1 hypothetical protein E5843_00935 [Luteimonas yindakuii]